MPLFFRKEVLAVCDEILLVTGAGIVNTGEINLIENAVAESEPNLTVQVKCRANARFSA
jgi:hypothetical protein